MIQTNEIISALTEFKKSMPMNKFSDKDWLQAMVKHHQMALTMSKQAIAKSKDEYVVGLAKDIIKSQSKQIDEMNKYIKTLT